ncbi:hypothetical protein Tco_0341198 [Tanacetum coccineum]
MKKLWRDKWVNNRGLPRGKPKIEISPLPSYEEKPPLLAKRKVTHRGKHSQSGMLQSEGLTSEVTQGKDEGLAGLLPLQEQNNTTITHHQHPKKSSPAEARKVQATTKPMVTNPGGEESINNFVTTTMIKTQY